MTLYDIKPAFQNLLRPLVRRLASYGATANQVTIVTALISVCLGGWLCLSALRHDWIQFYWVPLWMFLRMAFNAIDGMLAREFDQKTPLGAYLNELTDVVSDAALYLPFAFLPGYCIWPVLVFIWLSTLSEYTGALALMVQRPRSYSGPMGKSDRALVIGTLSLWIAYAGGNHLYWINYSPYLFTLLSILVTVNIVNRIRAGLKVPAQI